MRSNVSLSETTVPSEGDRGVERRWRRRCDSATESSYSSEESCGSTEGDCYSREYYSPTERRQFERLLRRDDSSRERRRGKQYDNDGVLGSKPTRTTHEERRSSCQFQFLPYNLQTRALAMPLQFRSYCGLRKLQLRSAC